MRIAIVGTKGIPAKWGGMEKYVEEIGSRLVQKGHQVTVFGSRWYCRDYKGDYYRGVRIRRMPTIHLQAVDALTNALMATICIMFCSYDIVHFHGYASYYFIPLLKKLGRTTVLTAHGVESGWNNPKYGAFARRIIIGAFKTGVCRADRVTTVADHLRKKIAVGFGVDAEVCYSGITQESVQPPRLIRKKYGLCGNDYLLFLGRIDPIKRVEWVLDSKDILLSNLKIVIAGGAQDEVSTAYLFNLQQKYCGDSRIVFTGPVTGDEKSELLSNCLMFVSASQDEGLPITLLEACSFSRAAVVTDIEAHREVITDGLNGFLFPKDDKERFLNGLKHTSDMPRQSLERIGMTAKKTVGTRFNWDHTADSYESLYADLLGLQD